VSFVDTNTDKKPQTTIIDDKIMLERGASDDLMLGDYSITGNEDGMYDLAFNVKENVTVDFVYNEDENVYEIHLEKGRSSIANFDRTFIKQVGSDLKIVFVNHGLVAYSSTSMAKEKKPQLIIQ
jgi:hypothetical protein